MFDVDSKVPKMERLMIAGFHLGFVLSLCHSHRSRGWDSFSDRLRQHFVHRSETFEVATIQHEPETHFPLGYPLMLRYRPFFQVFNILALLQQHGYQLSPDVEIDHMIWICPSGVVLLIVSISVDNPCTLCSLDDFDAIIMENYHLLSFIFTEVASVVTELLPNIQMSSALVDNALLSKILIAQSWQRQYFSNGLFYTREMQAWCQFIDHNSEAKTLFDEILMDVYYIDTIYNDACSQILEIGYDKTLMKVDSEQFMLIITIVYASFVGLLWLTHHLSVESTRFSHSLVAFSAFRYAQSADLKLLRIFALQLINESAPIMIRLTRSYMTCAEECWNQFRMHQLVKQINEMLLTLDEMFDWVDEIKREFRNFKIGLAAVLVSVFSLTAVTAELISTLDLSLQLDISERIVLISLGFTLGLLSTLAIYWFPITWYVRLRKIRIE